MAHEQPDGMLKAWGIVRRRWPLGLATLLASMSAAVSLSLYLPNVYRASTIVLVGPQQVPEAFVRSTVTTGLETRLQTISQAVLSRSRLEELIQELDLYKNMRARWPMDTVVQQMRRDVQVESRGFETMAREQARLVAFTVSYQGPDPKVVADVANRLASYYLTENSKAREQEASGTATFLRRQLNEVKARLEFQERLVSAFKRQHLGENPRSMDANLAVLERLTSQLRLNSDNQNRALERREALARQLAGSQGLTGTPGVGAAGLTDPVAMKLAQMRQELAELRVRFSDKYPDVVRLKAEIAVIEAQSESRARPASGDTTAPQPDRVPNPYAVKIQEALAEVDSEISGLRAEERRLREDFATYQRRVENTPLREQEFLELSRDYDTTNELYQTLLKRYEEAQLAETLEQRQKGEQFQILERAVPQSVPWAPDRFRLLVMGTALSLGLAVGVALLVEWLDGSFHDMDELERFTSMTVIGRIPRIVTSAETRRWRWRVAAWVGGTIILMTIMSGAAYATARGHVPVASGFAHAMLLRK